MITRETLLSLLEYDASAGSFTWRHRPRSSFPSALAFAAFTANFAGKRSGHARKDGYRDINIGGRLYLEHQLVWLAETGAWPSGEIDHENGAYADNRFGNLRDVTHAMNGKNMKRSKANRSGVTGVGWNAASGMWRAHITVDKHTEWLGYFATKQEAISARTAAERQHGFHPNHGRSV